MFNFQSKPFLLIHFSKKAPGWSFPTRCRKSSKIWDPGFEQATLVFQVLLASWSPYEDNFLGIVLNEVLPCTKKLPAVSNKKKRSIWPPSSPAAARDQSSLWVLLHTPCENANGERHWSFSGREIPSPSCFRHQRCQSHQRTKDSWSRQQKPARCNWGLYAAEAPKWFFIPSHLEHEKPTSPFLLFISFEGPWLSAKITSQAGPWSLWNQKAKWLEIIPSTTCCSLAARSTSKLSG